MSIYKWSWVTVGELSISLLSHRRVRLKSRYLVLMPNDMTFKNYIPLRHIQWNQRKYISLIIKLNVNTKKWLKCGNYPWSHHICFLKWNNLCLSVLPSHLVQFILQVVLNAWNWDTKDTCSYESKNVFHGTSLHWNV